MLCLARVATRREGESEQTLNDLRHCCGNAVPGKGDSIKKARVRSSSQHSCSSRMSALTVAPMWPASIGCQACVMLRGPKHTAVRVWRNSEINFSDFWLDKWSMNMSDSKLASCSYCGRMVFKWSCQVLLHHSMEKSCGGSKKGEGANDWQHWCANAVPGQGGSNKKGRVRVSDNSNDCD